tara:strand:+ start:956 stop:1384 length:429 start_codon:yes stop_codon:yes gene_type:complete
MAEYITKVYKGKSVKFKVVDIRKESVFNYVTISENEEGETVYTCNENIGYYSRRYLKWIIREAHDPSDGATGAKDIDSFSWLFHDELCDTGKWEDDEPCTNWEGSNVCSDILDEEGYWFRKHSWFAFTWLFGGKKLRKNGMF